MDKAFIEHFVNDWIESWNAHDLNRILAHYADDFEMSSPVIQQILGEPSGTLKGKANVGAYWKKALELVPDLKFKLVSYFVGVDSIVIHYVGARNRLASEVFIFDKSGKVIRASAHY